MSVKRKYPTVGVEGLKRIAANAIRTKRPMLVMGEPGIGKTAIVGQVAKAHGKRLVAFDVGNRAREDVMLPVVVEVDGVKEVVTVPLGPLKTACQEGVVLFADEATRADKNKQAILLMLCDPNNPGIGDYRLHPDTVVILAGNFTSSGGTVALIDALVNRLCVIAYEPTRDEVAAHLSTVGADGSTLRTLLVKTMAWAQQRVELLSINPPADPSASWASPRQLESALGDLAAWIDAGEPLDDAATAIVAGRIGMQPAAALFACLAEEDKLPTLEEIVKDPAGAKLPPDIESAIAAVGLMTLVAKKNPNAGWVYLGRYASVWKDASAVAAKALSTGAPLPTDPKARAVWQGIVGKSQLAAAKAR